MKVAQLIKKLEKLDGNLKVVSDQSGQDLTKVIVAPAEFSKVKKVWLEFR